MLLKLQGVTSEIGGYRAIRNVSLEINKGDFVSIIGANGAGKSTLFRTIAGIIKPVEGTIEFKGKRIDGLTPDRIVRMGLSLCPEGRRLFPHLSVYKNLLMGAYTCIRNKEFVQNNLETIYQMFPRLAERKEQLAGTFSGGEQQMLAIARALMSGPDLLLLDEPSLGLAPYMIQNLADLIQRINQEMHTAVFLSEQNAHMALNITQRGYLIENGEIVMEGTSSDLKHDEKVKKAYIGA